MDTVALIAAVFANPPMVFDESRQTLKNWAKYCLQERGFKVVYAQNADFALESRGEKMYVKLAEAGAEPESGTVLLVRDRATNSFQVIPPQP